MGGNGWERGSAAQQQSVFHSNDELNSKDPPLTFFSFFSRLKIFFKKINLIRVVLLIRL